MDTIDNMEFNRNTPIVKGEQFLPSIYMFSLGAVKELSESLTMTNEHTDDFVVAKYGYTKHFTNTTKTPRKKYEHIRGLSTACRWNEGAVPKQLSEGA